MGPWAEAMSSLDISTMPYEMKYISEEKSFSIRMCSLGKTTCGSNVLEIERMRSLESLKRSNELSTLAWISKKRSS